MRKSILLLFSLVFFGLVLCYGQARVIFNNNPYVVITNNAFVVVDNANPNAITLLGTGGNIISEGQNNRVKWNIGTSTGAYTVPFTRNAGNKIPLTVNVTGAGVGAGNLTFSTYQGAGWNNATYMPTGVTHMNDVGTGCCNNSQYVMDRFWIIDPLSYTTRPSVNITFTYIDNEWSAAGNTIIESMLFAQRFNTTLNKWGDWVGTFGTANTVGNIVVSGPVTPGNFFRAWTLVDQTSPLPIELSEFEVGCNENGTSFIRWTTESQTNNDFFTVEKSFDGEGFFSIGTVKGEGNNTFTTRYEFFDPYISDQTTYYRLKQTDYDGKFSFSDIRSLNPCPPSGKNIIRFFQTSNQTGLLTINPLPGEGNLSYEILDLSGRKISASSISLGDEIIQTPVDFASLPQGTYFLRAFTHKRSETFRFIR
jgi:hypothetical protein